MRLTIFVFGFALMTSPALAQTLLPAPSPEPMMARTAARTSTPTPAAKQVDAQANAQLNRQVTAVQQRLQQEELRLQGQFAQLQKMRAAALKKQNQKELERIAGLEKRVVADYEKRVEQVLITAQTQIQSTPIQVPAAQAQPTKATRSTQAQRTRSQQSTSQKRSSSKSSQSSQQSRSSGWWPFGRR